MSLADVIYNALTGQSGAARPSFRTVMTDMVQERTVRGVSRRQFARDVGIPESTLRRWERGAQPTARDYERRYSQALGAHRHLIAVPAMMDRWRQHNMRFTLTGFPEHGRQVHRTVSADQLELAPGTGDRIVDAFLRGDDRAAARALGDGIENDFYHRVFYEWLADEDLQGEHADSDYSMGVEAA